MNFRKPPLAAYYCAINAHFIYYFSFENMN